MLYDPNLFDQRLTHHGQWMATCPECGKKDHFYMSSKTGLWDCKKCGIKGNWYLFEKKYLVSKDIKKTKKRISEFPKLVTALELSNSRENLSSSFKKPTFPSSAVPAWENQYSREYIFSRGFDIGFMKYYDLHYSDSGLFWNRIIIPIYMKKCMMGYVARWIPTKAIPRHKKKYFNSPGVKFSKLIWNYDQLEKRMPVVLCEGVFSAARILKNSGAVFGKNISARQIKLLRLKGLKTVIPLFDDDAKEEVIKDADRLLDAGFQVRLYDLKGKDIDDMNPIHLYEEICDESEIFFHKKLVSFCLAL